MDARTILRKNAAILKLDEHTIDELARVSTVQRLRRGEALWRAGERASSLVVVGHGLVKVLLPATGARDLVLGLYGPGESVGDAQVLEGAQYPAESLALTEPVTIATGAIRGLCPAFVSRRRVCQVLPTSWTCSKSPELASDCLAASPISKLPSARMTSESGSTSLGKRFWGKAGRCEAGAPGGLADPGSARNAIAFERGAQVIDLVPHNDPEISVVVRGIADGVPVGDGDCLNPLDPDRIVHVAELVDVLGLRREAHLEGRARHNSCGTPFASIECAMPASRRRLANATFGFDEPRSTSVRMAVDWFRDPLALSSAASHSAVVSSPSTR